MKAPSHTAQALTFALEHACDALPDPSQTVFLRAEPLPGERAIWQRRILNVQSCKPIYDSLHQAGCQVSAELTTTGFALAILRITKHKQENMANLARCWTALRPGGQLLGVGSKDEGISSVEKAVKAAFLQSTSQSKHHCKIIWATRGDTRPDTLPEWTEAGCLQNVPSLGCWSQPGVYNWNKIDAGSALLIQNLPPDLQGRAADLGAGWGYLSQQLLQRNPKITSIDLYEAEALALHAAKANLEPLAVAASLRYHWHDVTQGLSPAAFDLVLMNPPFHSGKDVDIDLGRAFITAAAQSLIPGGTLFMVANRQLPYEQTLNATFGTHAVLAENATFKVLTARRI